MGRCPIGSVGLFNVLAKSSGSTPFSVLALFWPCGHLSCPAWPRLDQPSLEIILSGYRVYLTTAEICSFASGFPLLSKAVPGLRHGPITRLSHATGQP